MLRVELLVRETPASATSTLATHLYTPSWLVCRGAKVRTTTRGDGIETVTFDRVSFSITVPLELVHWMVGVSLSCCGKETVQVSVCVSPAKEDPVLSIFTSGASGTGGKDSRYRTTL